MPWQGIASFRCGPVPDASPWYCKGVAPWALTKAVLHEDPIDLRGLPDLVRQTYSYWMAMASMIGGRPHLFSPHPFLPFGVGSAGSADTASFYDSAPLRESLLKSIDL